MKKIFFSLMVILSVVAVAGVGSYALWNDTDTSKDNVITAGSLDLEFSFDNGSNWQDDLTDEMINVGNTFPGDFDSASLKVKNAGTIAGILIVNLKDITDAENSVLEPEADMGDDVNKGELCDQVQASIKYNGVEIKKDYLRNLTGKIEIDNNMTSGKIGDVEISYTTDLDADNTIMTDSCIFGIDAVLEQKI